MSKWEMETIRKGFADALVELGHETEDVVVLDADLAQSTLTKFFAKEFPDRFYDMGIAEQGMAATAAGMALMGRRPFLTSYAMFAAGRAWEIIRQQISYGAADVVVVGAHAGVTTGQDGPTHQCAEDLALMRSLPDMAVLVPCDYWEGYKAIKHVGKNRGAVYFRMGREKFPLVTTKDSPWELGKANRLADGTDGTVIACGMAVHMALEAREILEKEDGRKPRILNMHTIKPLDTHAVLDAARETGCIVTAEEHSVIGGLGSAVAETVVQSDRPVPMRFIGLQDRYLESGPGFEMLQKAGITTESIIESLRELYKKQN